MILYGRGSALQRLDERRRNWNEDTSRRAALDEQRAAERREKGEGPE
ncbi:hypothetical protein [Thiohalorhabdus methylotrophus]|uniref:Transposase n=1 Tax=Thiohalorhabdus methylotrophus TaxID=3242694 RepID=A0ABV4TXU1_9GAMM